jgi:hypothetical protein
MRLVALPNDGWKTVNAVSRLAPETTIPEAGAHA